MENIDNKIIAKRNQRSKNYQMMLSITDWETNKTKRSKKCGETWNPIAIQSAWKII